MSDERAARAERLLAARGFAGARVSGLRAEVARAVREAGFARVLLDVQGYRRGALNEGLAAGQLVQLGSGR